MFFPKTLRPILVPVAVVAFAARAALCSLALCIAPGTAQAQSTIPPASPDGVAQAVVRQAGLEGRVLWLDGTANLQRLATRDGVAAVLDHCVKANINTVVVDVKPLSGHVLYNSKIAPKLQEWRGYRYPDNYDLLRIALEEGHKRGLKIHANINVFSDGHKLVRSGPVYEKIDQQSIIYDVERIVTTPRGDRRNLAVGANRGPDEEQLVVYDSGYRVPRIIAQSEAFALVRSDRVEAVVDGSFAPAQGVSIPQEGYLLVGRGEGARWLLEKVRVGDTLAWNAYDKLIPVVDAPSETIAAFVNPIHPDAREYLLRIVDELVSGYDLDGVVFDRMRYASLQSDFSDFSRQKFEEYIGQKLIRFPGDVFAFDANPGRGLVRGPYFKQWLEWRARNIRTWLEQASGIVRAKRPQAKVGVYVGSWYSTYYTVGVNWASEEFTPGYDWMSPTYNSTGYAHLLDWVTTGCYHPIATREQARNAGLDDSYTVQAAAELSTRAVGDVAFVYAGLYVLDYKTSPEAFREAIQAARKYSHGVMLFDLVHIEEYGWWSILEDELREPRKAPHDFPQLLPAVRALRKSLSAAARNTLP
jgi:uncharacterized lipoprotein YddW (UPF0748 family)